MLELFDNHPDIHVQESEFKRLLGYPGRHVLEGRARELADATRQWYAEHGWPWIYARHTDALELAGGQIKINGTEFSSQPLYEQLNAAQAHSALLVAVSAGPPCEEKARALWQEGKPDEYFFMEMFGSAVVEHLVAIANGRICAWADQLGMAALPHYSPGYSGWDISDQTRLWELMRPKQRGDFPGELDVMESGMLRPKKSLLAIVGITRHLEKVHGYAKLVPCENCSLPGCQYRRSPYAHFPPQFEDVGRLQPGGQTKPPAPGASATALNHHAKYSVNLKALRKWSQERLQLKWLHDGAIQARFRYEGTTCSNLGRRLEFDYYVLLGPGQSRYKIEEASCVPAPGDTGHTCQCEYLKDPESLTRAIAVEKPLLGSPLEDVLAWERAYSPSGCYCDLERRFHKWGLVLEVIHFALVQREKEKPGPGPAAADLKQERLSNDQTL
jgi:hypothetical protein